MGVKRTALTIPAATLGQKLIRERRKMRATHAEIAHSINVTPVTYRKWETDNGLPNLAAFVKLCKKFGVSADYLLGMSNDQGAAAKLTAIRRIIETTNSWDWTEDIDVQNNTGNRRMVHCTRYWEPDDEEDEEDEGGGEAPG